MSDTETNQIIQTEVELKVSIEDVHLSSKLPPGYFYLYDGLGRVLFDINDYELGGLSKTNFAESFEIKELGEIEEGYYDSESVEGRDDVFGVGKISIKLTVLNTDNAVRFVALMWCTEAIKKIKIYNNAGKRIFHGFLSQDAVSANANNQEITLNFTSAHLHDVYFKNEIFYVDDNGNRQSKTVLNADLIDEIFGAGQSNWDKTVPKMTYDRHYDPTGGFRNASSWFRVRYILEKLLIFFGAKSVDFGNFNGIWNNLEILEWEGDQGAYCKNSKMLMFQDAPYNALSAGSKNELFDKLMFAKNWIAALSNGVEYSTLLEMLSNVAIWCGASVGIDGNGKGYVRPLFEIQDGDTISIANDQLITFTHDTKSNKKYKGVIISGYANGVAMSGKTIMYLDSNHDRTDLSSEVKIYAENYYFSTYTVKGSVDWYLKGNGASLYDTDALINSKVDPVDDVQYAKYQFPYIIDHNMEKATYKVYNYAGGHCRTFTCYEYPMNLFECITSSTYERSPKGATSNSDMRFIKPTATSNIADLIWNEKQRRRPYVQVALLGVDYNFPSVFRAFGRLLRPISFKKNITVPGGETEMIAVDITN